MVCTCGFLSWEKILARGSWNVEVIQLFLDNWIADCFVRHAWYALSVSFRGKFLAEGSWNFELVQLFLDSWIAECFVRHVWYALKIFDRGSWNFKLVHIFLINRMVLLGMHGLHCLSSLVMENVCSRQLEFWACPSMLGQLDCRLFH